MPFVIRSQRTSLRPFGWSKISLGWSIACYKGVRLLCEPYISTQLYCKYRQQRDIRCVFSLGQCCVELFQSIQCQVHSVIDDQGEFVEQLSLETNTSLQRAEVTNRQSEIKFITGVAKMLVGLIQRPLNHSVVEWKDSMYQLLQY